MRMQKIAPRGFDNSNKERSLLVAIAISLALGIGTQIVAVIWDQWYEVHTTGLSLTYGLKESCPSDSSGNKTCSDVADIVTTAPVRYFCSLSRADLKTRMTSLFWMLVFSIAFACVALIATICVAIRKVRISLPGLLVIPPVVSVVLNCGVVGLCIDTFGSWAFCGMNFCDLVNGLRIESLPSQSCKTNFQLSLFLVAMAVFLLLVASFMSGIAAAQIIYRTRLAHVKAERLPPPTTNSSSYQHQHEEDGEVGEGYDHHEPFPGGSYPRSAMKKSRIRSNYRNRGAVKALPPAGRSKSGGSTTEDDSGVEGRHQRGESSSDGELLAAISDGESAAIKGGYSSAEVESGEKKAAKPRFSASKRSTSKSANPTDEQGLVVSENETADAGATGGGPPKGATTRKVGKRAAMRRSRHKESEKNISSRVEEAGSVETPPKNSIPPKKSVSPTQQRAVHRRPKPDILMQLPPGDWFYDPSCDMYYCRQKRLYFDLDQGLYYDVESKQWYDPVAREWFQQQAVQ